MPITKPSPVALALLLLACGQTQETKPSPSKDPDSQTIKANEVSGPSPIIDSSARQPEPEFTAGDGYRVRLSSGIDPAKDSAIVQVDLVKRGGADSVTRVATIRKTSDNHRVIRADSTSIVLVQVSDYGVGDPEKLFLDPATKKLIKKVDYSSSDGLESVADSVAAAALGVPPAWVAYLKQNTPKLTPGEAWDAHLPAPLREHKMPNSTYKQFARARPDLVGVAGWGEGEVELHESPGPFQQVGDTIWFGKVFYEGEGTAGVGGVGYFDIKHGAYGFLDIPEAWKWSASALLSTYKTLYLGLMANGEGSCKRCGELLIYHQDTGKSEVFSIGDRILTIVTFNDALYMPTANGVSIYERGKVTRFAVEPDIDGKLGLIRVTPPPQGPALKTLCEQPIDAKYILSVATGQKTDPQMTQMRMRLIERGNAAHYWDLATFTEMSVTLWWKVLRADSVSAVFSRDGDYGPDHRMKVFFDSQSKKILKSVEYSTHVGIDSVSPATIAEALSIPLATARELINEPARIRSEGDSVLPPELRGHPMPTSSYDDFARVRPDRVADGYERGHTDLGEAIGPSQRVGSRVWFGKTFYDGEGITGVGGFGYFDIPTSTYKFVPIKGIAPWSVSAILLEDRYAWIGLVGHPEGADYSGGLLQYDLKTGITKKYSVDDVILRILREGSKLYLVTESGISVIEADRLSVRYSVEPTRGGGYTLVRR